MIGKASGAARSQETTHAHVSDTTLEGGLAPRDVAQSCSILRVLGRLLHSEDARLFFLRRSAIRINGCCLTMLVSIACTRADHPPADSATTSSDAAARPAPADTDDFGAPLPTDARFATRVVSLNPAATEVVFAIGADSLLVGRSRWDEFPAEAARVPALGDGIRPNVEAVLAARPTLVLLYATADNRAAAMTLENAGVRTIAMRVDHIEDFHRLVRHIGVALGAEARARTVSDTVHATLERVRLLTEAARRASAPTRVVWPVWESPVLVIGAGSYMDELLTIAGATNVFHDMSAPSPPVSIEEIARRAPEYVVTSSARAGELASNAAWRSITAVREKRFIIDSVALTGRPSVVLGMAAVHLARQLHPQLASELR